MLTLEDHTNLVLHARLVRSYIASFSLPIWYLYNISQDGEQDYLSWAWNMDSLTNSKVRGGRAAVNAKEENEKTLE